MGRGSGNSQNKTGGQTRASAQVTVDSEVTDDLLETAHSDVNGYTVVGDTIEVSEEEKASNRYFVEEKLREIHERRQAEKEEQDSDIDYEDELLKEYGLDR